METPPQPPRILIVGGHKTGCSTLADMIAGMLKAADYSYAIRDGDLRYGGRQTGYNGKRGWLNSNVPIRIDVETVNQSPTPANPDVVLADPGSLGTTKIDARVAFGVDVSKHIYTWHSIPPAGTSAAAHWTSFAILLNLIVARDFDADPTTVAAINAGLIAYTAITLSPNAHRDIGDGGTVLKIGETFIPVKLITGPTHARELEIVGKRNPHHAIVHPRSVSVVIAGDVMLSL